MSMFATPKKIRCTECRKKQKVSVYESINVTRHKFFIEDINNREINTFKCVKCRARNELAYPFLYHDMDKKIWVYCYPEDASAERDKITESHANQSPNVFLDSIGITERNVVFGYNDLFEYLKSRD